MSKDALEAISSTFTRLCDPAIVARKEEEFEEEEKSKEENEVEDAAKEKKVSQRDALSLLLNEAPFTCFPHTHHVYARSILMTGFFLSYFACNLFHHFLYNII